MLAAGLPYEVLVPQYNRRHAVVPGMTGLAQVRGLRGSTTNPKRAKNRIYADIEYIQNWSFGLDLVILIRTFFLPIRGLSALARKRHGA